MQLDSLLGNNETKYFLQTALKNNTLSHAVLISGPDGCGRGFVATALAADRIYPDNKIAAKMVMKGENTEVVYIEGEGASKQISVSTIRSMKIDIYKSSFSENGKAVIIYDAHLLTIGAANALLKVLEEPPENVQFILTTHNPSSMLSTICSRCTLYMLSPVSLSVCEQALSNALPIASDKNLPVLLSQVYAGHIGSGLKVLQDASRMDILRDAMRAIKAFIAQNRYQLLKIFSEYETKEKRFELKYLLEDIANLLLVALQKGKIDRFELPTPSTSAFLLPSVQKAQLSLKANISVKLFLSCLVIETMQKSDS